MNLFLCPRTASLPLPYPAVRLSSSLHSQGLPEVLGSLGPDTQESLGHALPTCVFAAFLAEEWQGPSSCTVV